MSFEKYLQGLSFSASTVKRYLSWEREFRGYFEGKEPKSLGYTELLAYFMSKESRGLSKGSLVHILARIRHYYKYLKTPNPLENFRLKGEKETTKIHYLSSEELDRIAQIYSSNAELEDWKKVALELLIYQGLNTKELSQLRIEALNLQAGIMTIPAQKLASRELKIEACQMFALLHYIQDKAPNSPLFPSLQKTELSNDYYQLKKQIKQELQKAKAKISFKNLAHLRASRIRIWIEQEGILAAKYQAGHKSLISTQAYQKDGGEQLRSIFEQIHPLF